MKKKFILMAEHRTGSTYLMNALNSHENIMCDNEIFNIANVVHFKEFGGNEDSKEVIWRRNADPINFMNDFYEKYSEFPGVVGFNFMVGHNYNVLMHILDSGMDILLLGRENKLAQFSSFKRGLATSNWATKHPGKARRQAEESIGFLNFGYKDFERWLHRQNSTSVLLERVIERLHEGRHLKLEYRSVVSGRCDEQICDFLEVPRAQLRSELQKQGASDIAARFSNPNAVRAYLDNIGRPEWAEEDLS